MESNEENVASNGRTYGRHACNAWNCKNRQRNKYSNGSLVVHRFPKEPERCKEWLRRAGREDMMDKPVLFLSSNLSLCSEHFEPDCYLKKNVLRSDALPTIFKSGKSSVGLNNELENAEYPFNDHVYCKLSPKPDNEEEMEVSEEYVTCILGEYMIPENSIVSYQPQLDGTDISEDNIENISAENASLAMREVTDNEKSAYRPENPYDREEHRCEHVNVDDTNIFAEPVSSCESEQICRLCATKCISHPKQSIGRWLGLLNEIVPGMVALDDGLPQQVCKPCLKKLYSAIRIKVEFTEADEKLQNVMGFIKSPSESEKNVKSCEDQQETDLHEEEIKKEYDEMEIENNNFNNELAEEMTNNYYENENEANSDNDTQDSENATLVRVERHQDKPDGTDENEYYSCEKCKKQFMSEARLKAHKISHSRVKKRPEELTCNICHGQFLFKKDLTMHVGTHFNGKPYGCEQCGKRYRSIFRLKTHKLYHFPPKFSCNECGKKFHLQSVLDSHMKAHSERSKFVCDICGKTLSSASILEGHLRMHKGLKPFQCNLCGKCYQSYDCLRFHKLRHRGARFFCEICGKGTKDRSAMKAHMNTHTKALACKCPICLKTFANANSRAKHLKQCSTTIVCIVCDKIFETVELLEDHRNHEHDEEQIQKAARECEVDSLHYCDACGLYIAGITQMESHMLKIHNMEGVFRCKKCLKCFLADDALQQHMSLCSVDKIRKLTDGGRCIICSVALTGTNEIMKHMRNVHKEYRPYFCQQCPKSFLTKKELEYHCLSHTERTPYKCSECNLSFKYIRILKTHKFEAHSIF